MASDVADMMVRPSQPNMASQSEQKRNAALNGIGGNLPGSVSGKMTPGYNGYGSYNRYWHGRQPPPGYGWYGNQRQQTPPNFNYDLGSLQQNLTGLFPSSFSGATGLVGGSLGLASELANEENRRQQEAFGLIRQHLAEANRLDRGMSQGEIDFRLGRGSDAATQDMFGKARSARGMLGASGITGGGASGALEGQLRLGRMGQIQQSRGELMGAEAARRAESANRMYERGAQAADFLSQGPSMLQLDQLNSAIDTGLNAFLGERQYQAARKASKDKKRSAALGGLTSLVRLPFGG